MKILLRLAPDPANLQERRRQNRLRGEACQGAVYKSEYPEEAPGPEYDKIRTQSFQKRVYQIYDFKRKLTLF